MFTIVTDIHKSSSNILYEILKNYFLQVREVRKELTRYAGEISGIKAGVKKGIKLK